MLIKLVKEIFSKFIIDNDFNLTEKNRDCVVLIGKHYDIIISNDVRENEIYIDFDLEKYLKSKNEYHEFEFPIWLNLNSIFKQMNIIDYNIKSDKTLNLEARLKIISDKLFILWHGFNEDNKPEVFLMNFFLSEKVRLKENIEIRDLKIITNEAHRAFKEHEYEKIVQLLKLHKDKLSIYDRKIYDYSINKLKH